MQHLQSRSRTIRVSSVATTLAWLVAVAALILLTRQLPNGTAPHQAAGAGSVTVPMQG